MAPERAAIVARDLVETDLMGHDTHGLNLAPGYLKALAGGTMAKGGEPDVVADGGALYPGIMENLIEAARVLGVTPPSPIA